MSKEKNALNKSIAILTWVDPTDDILLTIQEKHSDRQLDVIKRYLLPSSLAAYIRKLDPEAFEAIYFLYPDISRPFNRSYLQGLGQLCPVKKRFLIDLKKREEKVSLPTFLFYGIPVIILGFLLSTLTFILSAFSVAVLSMSLFDRIHAKDIQRKRRKKVTLDNKRLIFLCAEFPDSNFDFQIGGMISHIVGFFSGLDTLGFESYMVSSRPIRHQTFHAPNHIVDLGHFPPWPGEMRDIAFNWILFFKKIRWIKKVDPLVLYHRTSTFSFIGLLLSVSLRIPLVIEVNSSEEWKLRNSKGTRFNRLLIQIERINMRYADKIAVVSDIVKEYLVQKGVPRDKIIVNPNGVDPEFFKPSQPNARKGRVYGHEDKIAVGFIGSFNDYHGIITLAKSVRLVTEVNPHVQFILIGEGRLKKAFEETVGSDAVADHVTLAGKVPHESVPAILDDCDILVSPHQNMKDGSVFYGSPTKIFEYMAMGKGIVASNVGQLGYLLKHGQTALLVEPESPDALAKGILQLAGDEKLRKTLGENARKSVCREYSWTANVLRILEPISSQYGSSLC